MPISELQYANPVGTYIQTKGALQQLSSQEADQQQKNELYPLQKRASELAISASEQAAKQARMKDIGMMAGWVSQGKDDAERNARLDKGIDFNEKLTGQDYSAFRGRLDLVPILEQFANPEKQKTALELLRIKLANQDKYNYESQLAKEKAEYQAQLQAQKGAIDTGSDKMGDTSIVKDEDESLYYATNALRNGVMDTKYSRISGNGDPYKPTGKVTLVGRLGLDPYQQQELDVSGETKKTQSKAKIEIAKQAIDDGLSSAKAIPYLNRGISLLNEGVSTGAGDEWMAKVQRAFGIQSANQAEIFYLLRKSVLQQLRPIFGAAFTTVEGGRLEDIEASTDKSTEGNLALLQNAYDIARRHAEIGMETALETKNDLAARNIARYGNIKLQGAANATKPKEDLSIPSAEKSANKSSDSINVEDLDDASIEKLYLKAFGGQ